MMMRVGSVALLAVTLAGCGGGTELSPRTIAEVRDSAGITIVENRAGPDAPVLVATETRRIGVVEGDEPYMFSRIANVAVSPADTIFVANAQTRTVRVFDSEGAFVRAFGGRGQGPGELGSLDDLWLAGDTVVTIDGQRGGKTVLFTSTGDFLADWGGTRPDRTRFFVQGYGPNGFVAQVQMRLPRPETAPGDSVDAGWQLRWYDPVTDSLGEIAFEPPQRPLYRTRGAEAGVDWPIFRAMGSAFDARGWFYRTVELGYQVRVYDQDGRLARIVRRDYRPRSIGASDVDEYRRLAVELGAEWIGEDHPQLAEAMENLERRIDEQAALPIPETMPPIRGLLAAHDGTLWVENITGLHPADVEVRNLFGPRDTPQPETAWDIFDPDGRFVGQVVLPARFRPMAVRGHAVTGVMLDELDVEYVVTYEAEPTT